MRFDFSLAVDRFHEMLQRLVANLPNYILALTAFLAALLIGFYVGRQVRRAVARARGPHGVQNLLDFGTRIVFGTLGLLLALGILGIDAAAIAAGLGVAGLIFGIAFRDILENFMAGVVLLVRRPFTVGDRVATNGVEGVVTEVDLRSTILKTYDGEEVRVPNGAVLRLPLTNRTAFPVSRTVIGLRVAYASDLRQAVAAVDGAVRSVEGVLDEPAPEVAVVDFGETGVGLQARYWTSSAGAVVNRASIEARLAIKQALDDAGVEFALPAAPRPARDADPAGLGSLGAPRA